MRQWIREPKRVLRYHLIAPQNNPETLRRADGNIISGRNPVMRALDPLGFRFRKTLGQGGGGLALLVDLLDRNGQTDQWVVKVPLDDTLLGREATNMRVRILYSPHAMYNFIRSLRLLLMTCHHFSQWSGQDILFSASLYEALVGVRMRIGSSSTQMMQTACMEWNCSSTALSMACSTRSLRKI